jgi:hypothetical protein
MFLENRMRALLLLALVAFAVAFPIDDDEEEETQRFVDSVINRHSRSSNDDDYDEDEDGEAFEAHHRRIIALEQAAANQQPRVTKSPSTKASTKVSTKASTKAPSNPRVKQGDVVDLQLLSTMDWHANLEPLDGIGGAAAYSEYWRLDEEKNKNTLRLTAGDAFGATPALVSLNDEEPAVIAEVRVVVIFELY